MNVPAGSNAVVAFAHYRLPIYMLENGMGDEETLDASGEVNDQKHIAYLKSYVGAIREAIDRAADVRVSP